MIQLDAQAFTVNDDGLIAVDNTPDIVVVDHSDGDNIVSGGKVVLPEGKMFSPGREASSREYSDTHAFESVRKRIKIHAFPHGDTSDVHAKFWNTSRGVEAFSVWGEVSEVLDRRVGFGGGGGWLGQCT